MKGKPFRATEALNVFTCRPSGDVSGTLEREDRVRWLVLRQQTSSRSNQGGIFKDALDGFCRQLQRKRKPYPKLYGESPRCRVKATIKLVFLPLDEEQEPTAHSRTRSKVIWRIEAFIALVRLVLIENEVGNRLDGWRGWPGRLRRIIRVGYALRIRSDLASLVFILLSVVLTLWHGWDRKVARSDQSPSLVSWT